MKENTSFLKNIIRFVFNKCKPNERQRQRQREKGQGGDITLLYRACLWAVFSDKDEALLRIGH